MQKSKLQQLTKRIEELDSLADEVYMLAENMSKGDVSQPDLSIKGQRWYRGARELLASNNFSGLVDFDDCYKHIVRNSRAFADIGTYIQIGLNPHREGNDPFSRSRDEYFGHFAGFFIKAKALLKSLEDEVLSKELPIVSQLSFAVVSDEFDTANSLLKASTDEPILRAAGAIARVALERHLHVVIESNNIKMILSSSSKKKAESSDLIITLKKNSLITDVQKGQLEYLFRVGNNCAHPREKVDIDDVKKLVEQGRELAAIIV